MMIFYILELIFLILLYKKDMLRENKIARSVFLGLIILKCIFIVFVFFSLILVLVPQYLQYVEHVQKFR